MEGGEEEATIHEAKVAEHRSLTRRRPRACDEDTMGPEDHHGALFDLIGVLNVAQDREELDH